MNIEGVQVIFQEAVEHRAALVLRGEGLFSKITDVDPHEEGPVLESKPLSKGAEKTARILNEFVKRSHEILKEHEVNVKRREEGLPQANIVLPRGAGVFPKIENFSELYGMRAACIAGVGLIKGICRAVGMELIEVDGATGTLDTDMMAKAMAAVEALKEFDFVYVNVKAGDLCGHDGQAEKKVEVIEKIDKMVGYLRANMPGNVCLVITADHSTPVTVKDHSGDPVPILIHSSDIRRDDVKHFDEVSVGSGALGRIRGRELMPILLNLSNRAEKFGA
jgi:2,3-bisphosphoglycerate-independent phosphoglycerate mutase